MSSIKKSIIFTIQITFLITALIFQSCKGFSLYNGHINMQQGSLIKWNFSKIEEWKNFAKVYNNFAEIVFGFEKLPLKDRNLFISLCKKYNAHIVNEISFPYGAKSIVAKIPLNSISNFISETSQLPLKYVEPNLKFRITAVPNDPYWIYQWAPSKIEAEYAWNVTFGNSSILVAVIDTGIDWNHPDLANNYVPLGYDWVNNDNDPMDDNGHGTHCAGIIAAEINNNLGIAGLAQVRIMAEKGLNEEGEGYEDDLANAIIHATNQGAKIISMSWGGYAHSELIYDAISYAYDSGVLLVASAGNDATNEPLYPAAYSQVIAVSATDRQDKPATFTNYGEWIELAAPGVDIFSTIWDDTYAYMSGTSMACPHVAGIAALVWSRFNQATRDWIRERLRNTTDDLGEQGFDIYYGYGRINARKAVDANIHNIALTNITLSKTIVGQTYTMSINVTAKNVGTADETFNLTFYVESQATNKTVSIQTQNINLKHAASTIITFIWNTSGFDIGQYTVIVYAWPVLNESETDDNILYDEVYVTIPGDINGNKEVNIIDVILITGIYGAKRGDPTFNPNSDLKEDGVIDIFDVILCTSHYGEKG